MWFIYSSFRQIITIPQDIVEFCSTNSSKQKPCRRINLILVIESDKKFKRQRICCWVVQDYLIDILLYDRSNKDKYAKGKYSHSFYTNTFQIINIRNSLDSLACNCDDRDQQQSVSVYPTNATKSIQCQYWSNIVASQHFVLVLARNVIDDILMCRNDIKWE